MGGAVVGLNLLDPGGLKHGVRKAEIGPLFRSVFELERVFRRLRACRYRSADFAVLAVALVALNFEWSGKRLS